MRLEGALEISEVERTFDFPDNKSRCPQAIRNINEDVLCLDLEVQQTVKKYILALKLRDGSVDYSVYSTYGIVISRNPTAYFGDIFNQFIEDKDDWEPK